MSSERCPSPRSLAMALELPRQGPGRVGLTVPRHRPVATSQPILGHVPHWEFAKCSDFANRFEVFIDL